MSLQGERVVVVTGASRGAGKGIAVALAPGSTVYVTGRSQRPGDGPDDLPGTVYETAEQIDGRGGHGVPVVCDHADDEQVRALFERVAAEHGRLDILVNNAFALPPRLPGKAGFWEQSLQELDMLQVGLRSHYVAAYFAAPLLLANGEGLIVSTSAPAGRVYSFSPAFGATHAGADKLTHDMAVELEPFNVAALSIWMGLLKTERALRAVAADPDGLGKHFENAESPELTGLIIDALAKDPDLMAKTSKVYWGAELAEEYGLVDIDGRVPQSNRGWLGPTTEYSEIRLR